MDFEIYSFEKLDSTNKYCRKLGKKGIKKPTVVLSDIQTDGVGRLGRRWFSDFGGLYFSILLNYSEYIKTTEYVGKLNFIGGVSVYETLAKYINKNFGLKFPNDVVVCSDYDFNFNKKNINKNINNKNNNRNKINSNKNGIYSKYKKISGLLSEISIENNYIILGIGININNKIDDKIKDCATSLYEINHGEYNRYNIFKEFLNIFKENYHLSDKKILKKYKKYSITLNKTVKITTSKKEYVGKVEDIDYNGIYLKLNDGSVKNIQTGDCIHLR